MSVQTDMEMLYVHTLEEYALNHGMHADEVIIIFHENHVWSQMLLQYEYLFCEVKGLNVRHFDALTLEWLDFIKENRTNGKYKHPYDVVIGPVADDNTMETVQLYIAGILTPEESVSRLRYSKINNQISFHTEKALKSLRFIRREEYEEK